MRNAAENWPAPPDWDHATLERPGLTVRTVGGLRQTMVSGDPQAWLKANGMPLAGFGPEWIAGRSRYAVRMARDRILVVGEDPFPCAPGWHGDGFAVSAMDAGLHVFEMSGAGVPGVLARATALDPDEPQASGAVVFAGAGALLYRHGGPDRVRVHVDRGLAPYLWEWLERALPA